MVSGEGESDSEKQKVHQKRGRQWDLVVVDAQLLNHAKVQKINMFLVLRKMLPLLW